MPSVSQVLGCYRCAKAAQGQLSQGVGSSSGSGRTGVGIPGCDRMLSRGQGLRFSF